jgi:hypothetical protein
VAVVRVEHDPYVLDEHPVAPDDDPVTAARKDPTLEPGPLEHTPADTDYATVPRVCLSDLDWFRHLKRHLEEQLETRLRQRLGPGQALLAKLQCALL